jgi:hypothetical protein
VICDPLAGGGTGSTARGGLSGDLWYANDKDSANIKVIDDVIVKYGTKAKASVYMNQVNIPVRAFDQGFSFTDGDKLKDDAGNTVIEWFALKLRTMLVPSTTSGIGEGDYQLKIISDDGSVLSYSDNGSRIINHDGMHEATPSCSTSKISLLNTKPLPLELKYVQGPRFHIALQMFIRPWSKNLGTAASCSDTSAASGWVVVPAANFQLEGQTVDNPCAKAMGNGTPMN